MGPGLDVLGLAGVVVIFAALGAAWFYNSRRRRTQPLDPARLAAAGNLKTAPSSWTNVGLDDNERLPPLLRALAVPERAPLIQGHHEADAESGSEPEPERGAPPARRWPRVQPGAELEGQPVQRLEPEPVSEPMLELQPQPVLEVQPEPVPEPEPIFELPPLPEPGPAVEPDTEPTWPARQPLTFPEPVGASAMRLSVGMEVTELLDEPSVTAEGVLGTLHAGDEVEIIELADQWVQVVTPLGTTGWIPAAALGVA